MGGTSTCIPEEGTSTDIPRGGTFTDIPRGGTSTDIPRGGTSTSVPGVGKAPSLTKNDFLVADPRKTYPSGWSCVLLDNNNSMISRFKIMFCHQSAVRYLYLFISVLSLHIIFKCY